MKKENLISRVNMDEFKCLIFNNNKNTRHTKKHSKGGKNQQKGPEKDLMVDVLDKNFKMAALKNAQRTKRRCRGSFFLRRCINKVEISRKR